MLSEDRINELINLGFKRWTKGNYDRLYINAFKLGLECTYYGTGNISSAEFCGEHISNSEARRLRDAKTYIDVKTELVHSNKSSLAWAAAELAKVKVCAKKEWP